VKHTLYGRRDAGDARHQSSSNGDNIARLLAAATSAELALLRQSPDSKKRSRHFDGDLQAVIFIFIREISSKTKNKNAKYGVAVHQFLGGSKP